jgi:sortase system peptidoglycan-associated protein
MMKKKLLSTILGLSLIMPVAHASQYDDADSIDDTQAPLSTEEASGLGIGAIIGGLVAGPIGVFVGGVGGGLIGRDVVQDDENKKLRTELASMQLENKQLASAHNNASFHKTSIVESARSSSLEQSIVNGLGVTVQFRLGSANLEEHFVKQLEQLSRTFSAIPELHIHLSGHADRTGPESLNDKLAQSRAESVAGVLSKAGWPAGRIHLRSLGEHSPLTRSDDLPGYSFDRRVMITFSAGGEGA